MVSLPITPFTVLLAGLFASLGGGWLAYSELTDDGSGGTSVAMLVVAGLFLFFGLMCVATGIWLRRLGTGWFEQ